jgi:hypothetical protein
VRRSPVAPARLVEGRRELPRTNICETHCASILRRTHFDFDDCDAICGLHFHWRTYAKQHQRRQISLGAHCDCSSKSDLFTNKIRHKGPDSSTLVGIELASTVGAILQRTAKN